MLRLLHAETLLGDDRTPDHSERALRRHRLFLFRLVLLLSLVFPSCRGLRRRAFSVLGAAGFAVDALAGAWFGGFRCFFAGAADRSSPRTMWSIRLGWLKTRLNFTAPSFSERASSGHAGSGRKRTSADVRRSKRDAVKVPAGALEVQGLEPPSTSKIVFVSPSVLARAPGEPPSSCAIRAPSLRQSSASAPPAWPRAPNATRPKSSSSAERSRICAEPARGRCRRGAREATGSNPYARAARALLLPKLSCRSR